MNEITYTLIADGSSDKVFLRIIKWCLDDLYPKLPTKEQYADFRTLRNPPRAGDVLGQIKYAENYYPFDICFYHRDILWIRLKFPIDAKITARYRKKDTKKVCQILLSFFEHIF